MNYPHSDAVPVEWCIGDVILDLYEVQPVTKGFGSKAMEKPYHQGGFGRVYRVWHRGWNRDLAVKVPRTEVFITKMQKEAFAAECNVWVDLGLHQNIAACHYVRDLGAVPRVFSEYAPAGTLQEWIETGRLYEGEEDEVLGRIIDVAIQFAWGLHHAHDGGLIHQDVKPLNALMWNDGSLKVTDFGLAKGREVAGIYSSINITDSILVSSGAMTPAYCSPEQAAGHKVGRGTDIWSWAVSVLQMFVGDITWHSGTVAELALDSYLESDTEDTKAVRLPLELAHLLRECLKDNPDRRPRSLASCAERLLAFYKSETHVDFGRSVATPIELDTATINNRAVAMMELGQYEKAINLFGKGIEISPTNIELVYNVNVSRWRRGEITDRQLLQSLNTLKPFYEDQWIWEYCMSLACIESLNDEFTLHIDRGLSLDRQNFFLNHLRLQSFGHILVRAAPNKESYEKMPRIVSGPTPCISRIGSEGISLIEFGTKAPFLVCEPMPDIEKVWVDSRIRVICAISGGNTLVCWDATTGLIITRRKLDRRWNASLYLAPSGRYGLIEYSTKTPTLFPPEEDDFRNLHIVDLPSGFEIGQIRGHSPAFLNNSDRVISSDISAVYLSNVGEGRCIHTISPGAPVSEVKIQCCPIGA